MKKMALKKVQVSFECAIQTLAKLLTILQIHTKPWFVRLMEGSIVKKKKKKN